MDKNQAIIIAKAYIEIISKKYALNKALLFGSYAKGTFHDDSDIDIAIVLKDNFDLIQMQIDLMKLRRNVDLRIEPHPFNVSNFNTTNPVAFEILKYGFEI
jgi:predicted nucleotidyltransferase